MTGKTVVVVGASYGGLVVAMKLVGENKGLNVVLVDKRSYLDVNFASPRVLQEPEMAAKIVKPLSALPWMKDCKFVQATVTSIGPTSVSVEGGDDIAFDMCVICTGSTYASAFCKSTETLNMEDRLTQYHETAAQIKDAKNVLVIGGGATGMEVAAEAKEAGAESVTLVHSKDFLTNTPAQGKTPLKRLQKIGVKVVLGAKAEHVNDATYTINGEAADYDMVFYCVGFKFVHASLVAPLGDVLMPGGAMDVNSSFQVKGYSNIFALGDAVDVDDDHLAYRAMSHGAVVATAIGRLLASPQAKLPTWKRNDGLRMSILTLGKKNALALIGANTCVTYVPGSMLSKKLKMTMTGLGDKL